MSDFIVSGAPCQDFPETVNHTYLDTRVINSQRRVETPIKAKKTKGVRFADKLRTKRHLIMLAEQIGRKRLSDLKRPNLIDDLKRCHSRPALLTCGSHIVQAIPNFTCEFRLCPHCAARRSRKLLKNYGDKVFAFSKTRNVAPVHLVLTQKHRAETLKESVGRLMDSFRKLIRREFWLKYFRGGLYAVEVTKGKDGFYHTHLHILAFRKRFFDVGLLRSEWLTVTGDSVNLNLKPITDLTTGLQEILKYCSKPLDIEAFDSQNLRDFLEMKNQRLFNTFGEFRKFCATFDKSDFAHVFTLSTQIEPERFGFAEGDCCPLCDDPLFEVRLDEKEVPGFLRRIEQNRGRSRSPV